MPCATASPRGNMDNRTKGVSCAESLDHEQYTSGNPFAAGPREGLSPPLVLLVLPALFHPVTSAACAHCLWCHQVQRIPTRIEKQLNL